MKLIAESGSTKTDWVLIDKTRVITSIETIGLNPYHNTIEEISRVVKAEVLPFLEENTLENIFFYGAGCNSETKGVIETALKISFKKAQNLQISINNDLLAVARASCGSNQGIVCILGTGANACFFDGESITQNSISLGWALGDEGSGNFLGKKLLLDWVFKKMPPELAQKFECTFNPQISIIKHNLYKKPLPNRYLASFAPFLAHNISHPYCSSLVKKAFNSFFEYLILPYTDYQNHKMYFTGSIAFYFSDILKQVAQEHNFSIEKIRQKPILGLTLFHSQ